MTTQRLTLAVADLIDGDTIAHDPQHRFPIGAEVLGYPHAVKGMPGTVLPLDNKGLLMGVYTNNSEHPVDILREV
jgi:hypothetical protein